MKINKLLKVMSTIEESTIPSDMKKNILYKSRSRNALLEVGDMDFIHFMRVAYKYIPKDLLSENCEAIDVEGYKR